MRPVLSRFRGSARTPPGYTSEPEPREVADWLVLLTGEEAGSAGAGAWQCAASAVKQLVHAKAPVCHVCDLAEVVFKHVRFARHRRASAGPFS